MRWRFIPIVICLCFFADASAQCDFKKSKKQPGYEFISSPIGPTFFQWKLSLGRNGNSYFVVLHVEPAFVTADEPFKKKPSMTTQDALVLQFDAGDSVVLHPTNEISAKLESDGPVTVWRYHIKIEVGRETIARFVSNNLVKAKVEISGKETSRDIKPRQQLSLNRAARCVL